MIRSSYYLCTTSEVVFNDLVGFCQVFGTHEEFIMHYSDHNDLDDDIKELITTKVLWKVD